METNTPKENHCSRCATAHEEGYENCIDTHQPEEKCACEGELKHPEAVHTVENCYVKLNQPDSMEWEEEFQEKFGDNLIRQKAKLYSDGEYSNGHEKDWAAAEKEVESIVSFIRKEKALSRAEGEARKGESNRKHYQKGFEEGKAEERKRITEKLMDFPANTNYSIVSDDDMGEIIESLSDK